jgi:Yip1 domain
MNLFNRLQGVFFNPQKTFAAIAERPVWVDIFIIVVVAIGLFSYLTTPYFQKDTLQIWKDNVKMQEKIGKERFQQQLDRLANPSPAGTMVRALVITPLTFLIGFLFSGLIILVLSRLVSQQGSYRQVWAALLHANLIDKILGHAVRLALILTRKSFMQTSTGLALFFPKMDMATPGYVILSQFDFFQLWMFGVLAYGISAIFKIELKKALIISYGFWLLKAIFSSALGIIGLSFMR